MDISQISFSNFETAKVQQLLLAFIAMESGDEFVDGKFIRNPNRLTSAFIEQHFGCDHVHAKGLLSELIDGGFLDADRLAQLSKGMALANEKNLPRLPRIEAERIVKDLIAAAQSASRRHGARAFVESLDVFGSYLSDRPDLGDIDVLAIISIPEDCQPEDMDERDEVGEMLQVSEYISFTDEFDQVAQSAEKSRLFTRKSQSR